MSRGPVLSPPIAAQIVKQDVGIPSNARASVSDASSVFLSVGKFLDEHWALEGVVLAAPFSHSVKGEGVIAKLDEVATVKQLPPTLIAHYYFGNANSTWRPSLGAGVNYTRFFSAKASPSLESYAGGPTDVKLSSSFGPAVFGGMQYKLAERWHLNALQGYIKVNTTATLTTRNTQLKSSSPITQDLPAPIPALASNPAGAAVLDGVRNNIAQSRDRNLGTYERQIDLKLNPCVFTLSVCYSF